MMIFIEDNRIKIRKEGIFLCLDGGKIDATPVINLWKRFHNFIKAQCRNFDIPFKMGLLNWDKEIDNLPDVKFLSSNNISTRGRFITPLVEDIFSKLKEKNYDFIILSSDKIYDWQDWQDEINSRFNKLYVYDLESLERMTQIQLEEMLLKDIYNFRINDVTICFEDSLCYDLPSGFRLKIEEGKFILTKVSDSLPFINIDLKTYGSKEDARFTLNTCGSTREGQVKNIQPQVTPIENELEDEEIFVNSIENYKTMNFNHYCPLCKRDHQFSKAFICNQKRNSTQLFLTERIILNEIEAKRGEDTKYVVFWHRENKFCYQILGERVACVKDKEFIVVPDDGRISYIRISDRLECYEFAEIHKGLFYYLDEDMYILLCY